jgi:ABC-2 type transport system permease protein
MKKILLVASREFIATVATKGFILGLLATPLLLLAVVALLPRLVDDAPPAVAGEIAIIDPTGQVAGPLAEQLAPAALRTRLEADRERIEQAVTQAVPAVGSTPGAKTAMARSVEDQLGSVPMLRVTVVGAGTSLDAAKAPLKAADPEGAESGRLALVVIHDDAVRRTAPGTAFGSYDLFVRAKLDDRVKDEIRRSLRETLIAARVREAGLDRADLDAIMKVKSVTSKTVTDAGEQRTNEVANLLVPAGFMVLLLLSVFTGGQYLLMSTIEEKSNRVMEVLLSAVSPFELMTGKILGQMAVGLVVLALYAAFGGLALTLFASIGLLDPWLILFLLVFYLLAYLTIASLMAAIGSAVNDVREAQSLMMPMMLLVMLPWLLWMPILRDPNSALSTSLSFIPPVSNFVMLLRISSNTPPPVWQTALSIAVSAAGALAAVWFASRVFRVGVLMSGKPPDFATLVRWARMK